MIKNTIYLLLLCITSCSNNNYNNVNELDQKIKAAKEIECREIYTDTLLGKPFDIVLYDSLMFFTDVLDSKLLSVVDNRNYNLYYRLFQKGQGPNDLILPVRIYANKSDTTLDILEKQINVYSQYKIADLLNNNITSKRRFKFDNGIENMLKTDNGFIAEGFFDEGSIGLYNESRELKNIVNVYPDDIQDLSIDDKYFFGQGFISYNCNTKTLVYASYFTGSVKVIKLEKDFQYEILNSYNIADLEINKRLKSDPQNTQISQSDIECFIHICSDSDFFYLVYSGKKLSDKNTLNQSYIVKLDAFGNLLDCFKTKNYSIQSMAINDEKGLIGLALNKEWDYVLTEIKFLNN